MTLENLIFGVIVILAILLTHDSIDLLIMVVAGLFAGRFCTIPCQLILLTLVVSYCIYQSAESTSEMKMIYKFFMLYFLVSLLIGNIHYFIFNNFHACLSSIKQFFQQVHFSFHFLR